jgi:lipid II:glycine glycyltransferase (peptidoglycan interpeptide bridge formation enzyme)
MNSRPIPLVPDYSAEFRHIPRQEWNELLAQFSDASLYQTWDYDAVRCGEGNLRHVVLKHGDEIVAVAQARIAGMPGLRLGAAYIRWGPVWRRHGHAEDVNTLRMALRALRNEFVCRRGLFLRIYPLAFTGGVGPLPDLFAEENYIPTLNEAPQQTILLNVENPLIDIRKGFEQKWRNCLNHAERNSLEISQGTADALFEDFIPLYRDMVARKKFTESNDINEFKRIQASLPEACKMRIFLCRENGTLTGGAICSAMGKSGLYLFGATNDLGLKNKGAYLLQWHALQWLKDQGCKNYNLNGINRTTNPGSYHFKSGLAGRYAQEIYYLGRFDSYAGISSTTIAFSGLYILPRLKRVLNSLTAISRTLRGASPS